MSLLLEALKRAALEKQSKQDAAAAHPAVAPARPNTIPPVQKSVPDAAAAKESEDAWPIIDMSISEEDETVDLVEDEDYLNDTLDQENDIEPAIESLAESTAEPTTSDVDEDINNWDDFDELNFDEEDDISDDVSNFEFDQPKAKPPQKPLALEETEQALLEAKLQQEALILEQEAEEAREAEELENRQNKQRQLTARENRNALDQLIASGQAVARKSRRRAAFLYAMLVMTALGGILAYYFYLLANSGIAELQRSSVLAPAISVAEIIESAELSHTELSHTELTNAELTNAGFSDAESAVVSQSDENSNMIETEPLGNISGKVGSAGTTSSSNSPATHQTSSTSGTTSPTTNSTTKPTTRQTSETATRAAEGSVSQRLVNNTRVPIGNPQPQTATQIDSRPTVNSYSRPVITTETKGAQMSNAAEQVIIHFERPSTDINLLLKNAYAALQTRDLDQAEELYRDALALVPNQRDALLGAASTATAKGRFSDAASFYQRQLAADPKDSFARASLLALINDGTSRAAVQQEVAMLLKENPRSAHLHFLKGVGLAAGGRWSPAQSAFYEAYSLDNSNPDYAFNLAVALDHLKQLPLAQTYYERAVQLADSRPANFDKAAVQRRLERLMAP